MRRNNNFSELLLNIIWITLISGNAKFQIILFCPRALLKIVQFLWRILGFSLFIHLSIRQKNINIFFLTLFHLFILLFFFFFFAVLEIVSGEYGHFTSELINAANDPCWRGSNIQKTSPLAIFGRYWSTFDVLRCSLFNFVRCFLVPLYYWNLMFYIH